MDTMEIVRINDVIIEKIAANDKELGRIFGYTERQACERRREMKMLPSQKTHLRDGGLRATIKGFDEYLKYRKSPAWKKEMAKVNKMR